MRTKGSSLVASLVVILIIGILFAIFMNGGFGAAKVEKRPDNVGQTIIGRSAAKARDDVCRNNLSQVRMAVQLAQGQNDDKPPSSLEDLPSMPPSMFVCPIQPHEKYVYDPATGQVTCPHRGHERY